MAAGSRWDGGGIAVCMRHDRSGLAACDCGVRHLHEEVRVQLRLLDEALAEVAKLQQPQLAVVRERPDAHLRAKDESERAL